PAGTSGTTGERHPRMEDGVIVGAGAKILGPFAVGAGAKVGSNAVVTKPVPAGVTVVGNPGRVVVKTSGEEQAKRKAIAEKYGFEAYAVGENMPDPVTKAIGQLLDHLHAGDGRLEEMNRALKALGYCCGELPALRDEDFVEIKEEMRGESREPGAQG